MILLDSLLCLQHEFFINMKVLFSVAANLTQPFLPTSTTVHYLCLCYICGRNVQTYMY